MAGLELGPCEVKFGTAGAEVSLGKTQGGVTLRIGDDSVDLKSDQYGTSPEDTIITGTNVEVECNFAEVSFSLLGKILNQSTFGSATTGGVLGENNVGTSLKAAAQSLVLTKYVNGIPSTNPIDTITCPLAAPLGKLELAFDADNQRVIPATFKCFPKSLTANWGTGAPNAKTVTYYFGNAAATS